MDSDPDRSGTFSHHDLADFAQEFLRRSPAYRREYASIEPSSSRGRAMARRWGMEFRDQSARRRSY